MNYIKQMNAFYHQIEINPLSSSAISLWHALLHINNKTGWQDTFAVAGMVLRLKAGLQESAFKRARNELTEKGYITYIPGGSNRAPDYQVASLTTKADQPVARSETEEASQSLNGTADHTADHSHEPHQHTDDSLNQDANHTPNHTPAPLVKQNNKRKRKQNQTAAAAEKAITFYQDYVGPVSPFVADSIETWCQHSGEALVIEAVRRALKREKSNWSYVEGILNAWSRNHIQTVDEALAEEQKFRQNRPQRDTHPAQQEVIPDWFRQQKNGRIQASESEKPSQLTPEEKSETDRLLAKYGSKSG